MTRAPAKRPRADDGAPEAVVSEGGVARLEVAARRAEQPGSVPGFFNPRTRLGRDLAVLAAAHELSRRPRDLPPLRFLDAFAASGVTGLRVAVDAVALAAAEADGAAPAATPVVVLNDADAEAVALSALNAAAAGVPAETRCRPAGALLHEEAFDVVHVDPFGSVVPHLDAAVCRAPHGGVLALTATDVGPLYSQFPKLAERLYGADVGRGPDGQASRHPCWRELGARLLLTATARAAARHGRGIEPLLVVSSQEHFVCAVVRLLKGARHTDASVDRVRAVRHCTRCGAHASGPVAPPALECRCHEFGLHAPDHRVLGPLWIGKLFDAGAVGWMARVADTEAGSCLGEQARQLLPTLLEEAQVDALFTRRLDGCGLPGDRSARPKVRATVEALRAAGHPASRTHFDPQSVRTPVSLDVLRAATAAQSPGGTCRRRVGHPSAAFDRSREI